MSAFRVRTPAEVAEFHSGHPDVLAAARVAYEFIEPSSECTPLEEEFTHLRPACGKVSEFMIAAYASMGYKAHLFGSGHVYPILRSTRGIIVTDPTWGQYLEGTVPEDEILQLPEVLVGTRPEVVAFAQKVGFDDETLNKWLGGYGGIITERRYDAVEELAWRKFLRE